MKYLKRVEKSFLLALQFNLLFVDDGFQILKVQILQSVPIIGLQKNGNSIYRRYNKQEKIEKSKKKAEREISHKSPYTAHEKVSNISSSVSHTSIESKDFSSSKNKKTEGKLLFHKIEQPQQSLDTFT